MSEHTHECRDCGAEIICTRPACDSICPGPYADVWEGGNSECPECG